MPFMCLRRSLAISCRRPFPRIFLSIVHEFVAFLALCSIILLPVPLELDSVHMHINCCTDFLLVIFLFCFHFLIVRRFLSPSGLIVGAAIHVYTFGSSLSTLYRYLFVL